MEVGRLGVRVQSHAVAEFRAVLVRHLHLRTVAVTVLVSVPKAVTPHRVLVRSIYPRLFALSLCDVLCSQRRLVFVVLSFGSVWQWYPDTYLHVSCSCLRRSVMYGRVVSIMQHLSLRRY